MTYSDRSRADEDATLGILLECRLRGFEQGEGRFDIGGPALHTHVPSASTTNIDASQAVREVGVGEKSIPDPTPLRP